MTDETSGNKTNTRFHKSVGREGRGTRELLWPLAELTARKCVPVHKVLAHRKTLAAGTRAWSRQATDVEVERYGTIRDDQRQRRADRLREANAPSNQDNRANRK